MKLCKKCGNQFPTSKWIDGKRRALAGRTSCLDCNPYRPLPPKVVKHCKKCGVLIPAKQLIDGKVRFFNTRSYCLECSPWGAGNRLDLTRPIDVKTCRLCNVTYPRTAEYFQEFFKKSKKRYLLMCYCLNCLQARTRRYQERNRAANSKAVNDYKVAKGCADCGYNNTEFPQTLDFDHLNGDDKHACVSEMLTSGLSLNAILTEMAKCEVVCSNCHRIRTAVRRRAAKRAA